MDKLFDGSRYYRKRSFDGVRCRGSDVLGQADPGIVRHVGRRSDGVMEIAVLDLRITEKRSL